MVETETELLAEERGELVAEVDPRPADPERVTRTSRDCALAADAHVVGVLDRIGHAVGDAESEEDADSSRRIARRAPDELVEVVVDGPGVVHGVDRLRRHEQLREEAREDSFQERSRVLESRKLARQEEPRQVRRVLLERHTLLVAPSEADELVAHEAERLDREAAFARDQHAVLERLGDVVVGRRAARIEYARRQHGALPRQDHESSTVGRDGEEGADRVDVEAHVEELRVEVVGELVGVRVECVDLAGEQPELRMEELREGRVQERRRRMIELGEQRGGVERDDHSGRLVHAASEAAHGIDLQKPTGPEPELLRVDVERVLGIAPQIPARVPPAAQDALRRQQHVRVEHDALLAELVAEAAPAPREPLARPEVAAPGFGNPDRLRARDVRQFEQAEQADRDDGGAKEPCRHCADGALPVNSSTRPARRIVTLNGAPGALLASTSRTFARLAGDPVGIPSTLSRMSPPSGIFSPPMSTIIVAPRRPMSAAGEPLATVFKTRPLMPGGTLRRSAMSSGKI